MLILGHTGTIGRYLFRNAQKRFDRVTGISRSEILTSRAGSTVVRVETSTLTIEQILSLAENDSWVINSAWTSNERKNRNSAEHILQARWECKLVEEITKTKTKYISIGSIAEVDHDYTMTSYAEAKNALRRKLEDTSSDFLWLRVASAYGLGDRRDWFLTQVLDSMVSGKTLELNNPNRLLNFCHLDELSNHILDLACSNETGTRNIYTSQWYKLDEVVAGIVSKKEPTAQESPLFQLFDSSDPNGSRVFTPQLIEKIEELVRMM